MEVTDEDMEALSPLPTSFLRKEPSDKSFELSHHCRDLESLFVVAGALAAASDVGVKGASLRWSLLLLLIVGVARC